MIAIGIILIVLMFCILCGIASISTNLEVMTKNQLEIIKLLKNK